MSAFTEKQRKIHTFYQVPNRRPLTFARALFVYSGFLSCLYLHAWVQDGTTAALMEGTAPKQTTPVSVCQASQDSGRTCIILGPLSVQTGPFRFDSTGNSLEIFVVTTVIKHGSNGHMKC